MRQIRITISLLVIVCVALISPAGATRVALVIGNAKYQHVKALDNAVNDAKAMAKVLGQLGFAVTKQTDASQSAMEGAIRNFAQQLKQGDVALFYYSGHGVQVNGVNYLIPVDADIARESEVKYKSVDVGMVVDTLIETGSRMNIVILDACRNNPFRGWRSLRIGLAPIQAPADVQTFIAYATAPDTAAYDGDTDHSPYTQSLLNTITTPGLAIEQLFKQVRIAVKKETADLSSPQTPWEASSLTEEFYFAEGSHPAPIATPQPIATLLPTAIPMSTPTPRATPTPLISEKQQKVRLRSKPVVVSEDESKQKFNLDDNRRPRTYINNDFEDRGDVVVDYTTGLMWQKSGSGYYKKYANAQKYIEELNRQNFAGYNDWRLPTVPELLSLMTKEKQSNGLYINLLFDKNQSWCWSSDKRSVESAWDIYFNGGNVNSHDLSVILYVRAVRLWELTSPNVTSSSVIRLRSEPITVSEDECKQKFNLKDNRRPRTYINNDFEDHDNVVMDHATGLMWQKSGSGYYKTYTNAQKYIEELNHQNFAGYNDWRLPTVPELLSLMTKEKQSNGLYINLLFDKNQSWCWSSDKRSAESAWDVYFNGGNVNSHDLSVILYVRAVRSLK